MQTLCEGYSLERENSRTRAGQTFAFPPSASLGTSKVQVKHLTGPERVVTVCAELIWAVKGPSYAVRWYFGKALEAFSEKGGTVKKYIGNPGSVGSDPPVWL